MNLYLPRIICKCKKILDKTIDLKSVVLLCFWGDRFDCPVKITLHAGKNAVYWKKHLKQGGET